MFHQKKSVCLFNKMPPSNYTSKTRVPKGSHRMPDGTIMKDSAMKKKKKAKKKIKIDDPSSSTSYASECSCMPMTRFIDVAGAIKKDKEIKETDVFDFSFRKAKAS
tara:strand:- start:148 stop:465 length:318 start_codon:yes stop_codon:yes gene_type:complete